MHDRGLPGHRAVQDFDASLDQVEAGRIRCGPMPVVVLTASVKFAELVPQYIDEGLLPADHVPATSAT